jgi:hypothetical protein
VVEELAEVGVARRNLPWGEIVDRHRLGDLQPVRLSQLLAGALRPHARETERRHRLLDCREHPWLASERLVEEPFAEHK